ALHHVGLRAEAVRTMSPDALSQCLVDPPGPIWLLRAGSWLTTTTMPSEPSASATRLPLCALGIVQPDGVTSGKATAETTPWASLQAATGGDFSRLERVGAHLPDLASVYLEAPLVKTAAEFIRQGQSLVAAVRSCLDSGPNRVVRFPPLDVYQ